MPSSLDFAPVSQLLGEPVFDVAGTVVGRTTEFLVDEADGRIAYVQFDLVREDAAAHRVVVVPWSSMRPGKRPGYGLHLCVCRKTLENLSTRHRS